MPTTGDGITAARGAYLPDGDQPASFSFEGLGLPINNESLPQATPTTAVPADSDTELGQESTPSAAPSQVQVAGDLGAPVDLWDSQAAGGYWWTVMPVEAIIPGALSTTLAFPATAGATTVQVLSAAGFAPGDVVAIGDPFSLETVSIQSVAGSTLTLAAPLKNTHNSGDLVDRSGGTVVYRDMELLQDVMAAGRYGRIAKNSEPTLAAAGELFASGLSSQGKLISAKRTSKFYGNPLVAWTPALGADVYEVQWSKSGYPFKPEQNPQNGNTRGTLTLGTAAVLPLTPGAWYYRVRGFNWSLPTNAQQMAWSNPAKIVVAKPQFKVVGPGK